MRTCFKDRRRGRLRHTSRSPLQENRVAQPPRLRSLIGKSGCETVSGLSASQNRLPGAAHGAIVLLLIALTGCVSARVDVTGARAADGPQTVVILPPDASPAATEASDYSLYGAVGAQGCSALTERALREAFSACAAFQVVPSDALRAAMEKARWSIEDLSRLDTAAARALGTDLGADLVVTGRILECRTRWYFLISRTSIRLTFVALQIRTGAQAWRAEAEGAAWLKRERSILPLLADALAAKAAARR